MVNQTEQDKKQDLVRNIRNRVITVTLFLLLGIGVLFVSAGRLDWNYGWLYSILTAAIAITGAFILPKELIAERGRKAENTEKWDRVITRLILIPWIGLFVAAGLDFRLGLSPDMALPVHIAGTVLYLLGNALTIRAMSVNAFFSTSVRIQYDRGHTVCSGGPYRYIRHPGYLGMIVYFLSAPFILGSYWALIPAFAIAAFLLIRTGKEDRTLMAKLKGYREYSNRVRFRIFPGLW